MRDYTRAPDGTIALCGTLTDANGSSSSYVAWLAPTGETTQVIRTSPYIPMRVALAPDGTIWAQGNDR